MGVAGGVYHPSPEQMLAIRTWLAGNHAAFRKIAKGPEKMMGELHGDSLKRIPKGFPADHPAAESYEDEAMAVLHDARPETRDHSETGGGIGQAIQGHVPVMEALTSRWRNRVRARRRRSRISDLPKI